MGHGFNDQVMAHTNLLAQICSLPLDVGWATSCAFYYVGELTVLEHATRCESNIWRQPAVDRPLSFFLFFLFMF